MKRLTIGKQRISKNTRKLQIEGVSPSFVNTGNTDVVVLDQTIKPGGQISADYGFHFVSVSVDIDFIPSATPESDNNSLIIYTGNPCKDE